MFGIALIFLCGLSIMFKVMKNTNKPLKCLLYFALGEKRKDGHHRHQGQLSLS